MSGPQTTLPRRCLVASFEPLEKVEDAELLGW
jgi:hypothetical protein